MATKLPEPAIGTRLKELRKERGLALSGLAAAISVSEATLSRVENSQTPVSAQHLYELSRTLGVDITTFFEGPKKNTVTPAPSSGVSMTAGQAHVTSIFVNKKGSVVFAFMADPEKLHRWSFGTWETEIAADGLVTGTSIFDGTKTLVRIDADHSRLSIDYRLGSEPERLVPRINVRIVPGERLSLDPNHCVLTLTSWRTATMDDDRWRRLTVSHELEVVLIKNLLENGRV